MSSVVSSGSRARAFLLWAAPAVWLGCGGGGTDVVLPALSITTATQGVELDPDGYTLTIDGAQSQPLGVSGTVVVERLSDGEHSLELSGMAPNCSADGQNPRNVSIRSGATTSTAFTVTCSATSGAIEITTSTGGSGTDLDGFVVVLDGADRGPISVSAALTLSGIGPGNHSIGLTGLAGNCQVVGDNPREVTVTAAQAVQVPFAVTCVAPGPAMGTLDITTSTTGSDPDPDGYGISLDGGASQPIGINARLTLTNVPSATHQLQLVGVAPNCQVSGANPRSVPVATGQTATAAFTVNCATIPPAAGSVRVTVSTTGGSPDQDGYTISVDGAAPQSIGSNGSRTIQGLTAGAHSIQIGGVAGNCSVTGGDAQSVTVVPGQTATVAFAVTCVATGPSINLRIEQMYVIQSVQRLAGDVPLVQGRDAMLRVFATASGPNSARPSVRLRVFQNEVEVRTLNAAGIQNSTPTEVQQDQLRNSWNFLIPGSLVSTGTSVLVDVDPDNQVAETNEGDNTFPTSGTPRPLGVRPTRTASIRLVPIFQSANNLEGRVGNAGQLVDLAQRIYPLNSMATDVRQVFTATGPLQPDNGNNQWGQILSDLEALRIADNATDRTYYGLVRLDYGSGIVGNGFVGAPSAIGTDNPADAGRVLAHELGHTWGELHTPCGNPPGIDTRYPYRLGNIGVYGYDAVAGELKPPALPDIMGYCANPWISDYIYERVMNYRALSGFAVQPAQPSLLVWGHIVQGQVVLEPAVQIVARPHLPRQPGPYSLEATAEDGSRLFALSFEAIPLADDPQGSRHFAFAVPLDPARAARLGNLRLTGPGAQAARMAPVGAQTRKAEPQDVSLERDGAGVTLRWNAMSHPMIIVRDAETGAVLSFARGGNARVWTGKDRLDLQVSDGLKTQSFRRAISR